MIREEEGWISELTWRKLEGRSNMLSQPIQGYFLTLPGMERPLSWSSGLGGGTS
jgi:hypothetical protein